ncbi:Eukaryotic translation initiation factor 5A [Halotydeus destructor]|nr:Eukaryotic translation initiation factor 5A [Halotydeus destructor]
MLKWTRFVGRDVFTNETYEEDFQPHEDVEVPEVTLKEYPVASTGYAHLVLKNEDGNMKSIAVPKIKLWNTIKVHFDFGYNPVVTVVTALGEEKVVSFRSEAPEAFVVIDLVEGDK